MLDLGHDLAAKRLVGVDEGAAYADAIIVVHIGDGHLL
jgi:hypothetical protein